MGSRVFVGGLLWALVYNSVWAVAWFAFMRRGWLDATAALRNSMPWTEIWAVSAALTLPLGVAAMAYVAGRARTGPAPRAALAASLALWVPMTMGMAGWGWYESLSLRILMLDSAVNLLAIGAAVLAGARWHERSG
jgi:hypothetical protein